MDLNPIDPPNYLTIFWENVNPVPTSFAPKSGVILEFLSNAWYILALSKLLNPIPVSITEITILSLSIVYSNILSI